MGHITSNTLRAGNYQGTTQAGRVSPGAARSVCQLGGKQQATPLEDSDPSHLVLMPLGAPGVLSILLTLSALVTLLPRRGDPLTPVTPLPGPPDSQTSAPATLRAE